MANITLVYTFTLNGISGRWLKMRRLLIVLVLFFTVFRALSGSFVYPTNLHVNDLQKKVMETALTMVGGKYGWGSYDPVNRVFDCWNFAAWVYHTALDDVDRIDHMIMGKSDLIWVYFENVDELRPGDLLYNGGGHTVGFHAGIYIGNGKTVEARGGSYGINIFSIKGDNRFAPFGPTGNRFCYYSLLVRLWLSNGHPFVYAYLEEPPSYFFKEDGLDLLVHYYSLPFLRGHRLIVEMIDAIEDKVIWQTIKEMDTFPYGDIVVNIHVPSEEIDISNTEIKYLYFRVRVSLGTRNIFLYDTKTIKLTEAM